MVPSVAKKSLTVKMKPVAEYIAQQREPSPMSLHMVDVDLLSYRLYSQWGLFGMLVLVQPTATVIFFASAEPANAG